MSSNCFESIWQAWHFNDNSQQTQDSRRLFKIWPMYEYFIQKVRSVYKLRPKDNVYNSVRLAQTLLHRNMRVCGTVRANRGIPHDLEGEGKCLKKGESVFQRKGDIMVQAWEDKRLVRMTRTIHDGTIVNTGSKDTTNMEIKKP